VTEREDMIGMDTAILAHPRTWDASGHTENFGDFLIDDKKT
jgi:glycyl-tRNA synthetase